MRTLGRLAAQLLYVLWFLAGVVGGFFVAAVATTFLVEDPEDKYRQAHRGAAPHREVTDSARLREVCNLAEEVSETRAWQDGVIGPDRQLAPILWSTEGMDTSGETSNDIDWTLETPRAAADRPRPGLLARAR